MFKYTCTYFSFKPQQQVQASPRVQDPCAASLAESVSIQFRETPCLKTKHSSAVQKNIWTTSHHVFVYMCAPPDTNALIESSFTLYWAGVDLPWLPSYMLYPLWHLMPGEAWTCTFFSTLSVLAPKCNCLPVGFVSHGPQLCPLASSSQQLSESGRGKPERNNTADKR